MPYRKKYAQPTLKPGTLIVAPVRWDDYAKEWAVLYGSSMRAAKNKVFLILKLVDDDPTTHKDYVTDKGHLYINNVYYGLIKTV